MLGVLKNIQRGKFPGPDVIYPRTLREARGQIAEADTDTFVSSLDTGEFPEDWKITNEVTLFEKGNTEKTRKLFAGNPYINGDAFGRSK